MINSVITIGGHLIERIMCDDKGASLTMPTLYPGLYQFKLKLFTIGDDGQIAQTWPKVTSLIASIGLIYAEPRAGTFKLRYGPSGTPTEEIQFNEDAQDFQTKLAALTESTTYQLSAVYQPTPSTWMCKFDNPYPNPLPLEAIENFLEPETFVRFRQFQQSGEYWVEVRLMQGPIASTNEHDNILPTPPSLREIRRGFTDYSDPLQTIIVNEVQAIYVPPGFVGTYIIKFQGRQTRPMSANDGPANIQQAMNAMFTGEDPPQTRFTVTNPEVNNAYIEFVGPLQGLPFLSPPLGNDITLSIIIDQTKLDAVFNLDLNTVEVADALRTHPAVNATMEINLHITDPAVETDPGQDLILFQTDVIIQRPLHWEGLEAAAPINWLYPPNPKDYIPFDISQIITGNQSYSEPFGDPLLSSYSINHMLASDACTVSIRENTSNGRQLDDDEYEINFDNANALTITLPSPPLVANSLVVIIHAHGPVSAFLGHHHEIEDINGLVGIIDQILVRLSTLEAYLPTVQGLPPPGAPPPFGAGENVVMTVTIPDLWNVVPTNRLPGKDKPTDPSKLPSQGLLLPAVHDAILLGAFTADPATDMITLDVPYAGTPALADGQRVRLDPPVYTLVGDCTFDSDANTILITGHGLVADRRVTFSGNGLPTSISPNFVYYVINPTTDDFQIASTVGGEVIPILEDWDPDEIHSVSVRSEPPGGLIDSVDYFMIAPTSTQFQVSATLNGIPGPPIDITSPGYPPFSCSSLADAPPLDVNGRLPDPTAPANAIYIGHAYSVRVTVPLAGGRGIRATIANPGDLVASDGRLWYPVTRSDSPGANSFYPTKMENEIFRLAINDRMLAAGLTLTLTFDLDIRMYKHTSNIQYLIVVEYADLPSVLVPSPTGPNLQNVVWNKTPIMQQKLIVTELSFIHQFGIQVLRLVDGRMKTNKKIYGVQVAGDSIPPTANFALRCRLIEFDTEDNVKGATGLVYYNVKQAIGKIARATA